MIEVLSAGALTTIQDRGRYGCLRWGVGTAGAMDGVALAAGNLLLGNEAGCAAVEIQVFPFRVRFHEATAFALTGADTGAKSASSRFIASGFSMYVCLPEFAAARNTS